MERIGIFGGTFDPVHCGHLAIAKQATKELGLEQMLFIPAPDPPHKQRIMATYGQRLAMLELALTGHSCFSVSLLETELSAPSYTVDTLLELRKRLTGQFYFLIGADSLLDLHQWYKLEALLQLTSFAVISRPGIDLATMQQAISHLPGDFLPYDAEQMRWQRKDGTKFVLLLNQIQEDISSSAIRAQLRRGETTELLDKRVMGYIEQEGLYKTISHTKQA